MSIGFRKLISSSIVKKQLVAVTGLMLVGFIIVHLIGNFLLFLGPEALNDYSAKLHAVPELLWAARIALIMALVVHVCLTILLTIENRAARPERYYAQTEFDGSSMVKKTMHLTGALVFFYLFLHLYDFTLRSHEGAAGVIAGTGVELGLYGLVWNSFLNPLRDLIYIAAVCCVGAHLSHGIQSLFQTLGYFHDRHTPGIRKASIALGIVLAAGFSSIPIYVLIRHYTFGPGV